VFQMHPLVRHSYYPLIKAGVKVYEWQGIVKGHGSLHSKFAVIDDRICIIGSYNLDPRSKILNSEDAVLIYSEKAAFELATFVIEEDIPRSKLISLEKAKEWRNPKDLGRQFQLLFALALEDWW
jgi:cardiolipin synthase